MGQVPVDEKTSQPPAGRGQRLWAFLLVVDSFFVIIFGGALAAKVYQHWQAPPTATAPGVRRAPRPANPKPPEQAAASAPAAPAPKETAAPKPAPAKPSSSANSDNGPRPPKPSLIHEAPTRQMARLQAPGSAPGASAAPAAPAAASSDASKVKAVPTEFSLRSPGARTVELAGAFIVNGGKKPMASHPDGTWTLTLYLTPNTYRYWFLVNGKRVLDPQNSRVDRGASVLTVTP